MRRPLGRRWQPWADVLGFYANTHPRIGFPSGIRDVVLPQVPANVRGWLHRLDETFAADPLVKDGYRFRYLRTRIGSGDPNDSGSYEITAEPVEFGSTGAKSYFMNEGGLLRVTTENRPATEDDPRSDDD